MRKKTYGHKIQILAYPVYSSYRSTTILKGIFSGLIVFVSQIKKRQN